MKKSKKMKPISFKSALQARRGTKEDGIYLDRQQSTEAMAVEDGNPIIQIAPFVKNTSLAVKRRLKRARKISTVVLFAWLFMNNDPGYAQKILGTMVASRMLSRALTRPMMMRANDRFGHGGLSAIEAIALIQAINNNRGALDLPLRNDLMVRPQALRADQRQLAGYMDQNMLARQAGGGVIPVAVLLAAVAAFLAAALAGATPLAAAVAAFLAAAAALLAALLALLALLVDRNDNKNGKNALVKKLIIKKTVLPFVIPIPFKKKEKEIIYKYIPKPIHHVYHDHSKKSKKYKKHYEYEDDYLSDKQDIAHVDKVKSVVSEQDRIQALVDDVIEGSHDLASANSMMNMGNKTIAKPAELRRIKREMSVDNGIYRL